MEYLNNNQRETIWRSEDNWNNEGEFHRYMEVISGQELFETLDSIEGVVFNNMPLFDDDFKWLKQYINKSIEEIYVEPYILEPSKFILVLPEDGERLMLEVM